MSYAAPAIDRPAATAAVAFLCAVAAVHLFVVPVTIGVAVDDLGFDEKQVGDALGIAGVCYVLVVLTSPLWIVRWSWRSVCGSALPLGTVATLGLTIISSYSAYVGLQIALSTSLGLLFPPIMSALGSASEPDKKFGAALFVQSVLVGYGILLGRQTEDLFVLAVCIINVSFGMTTAYAFATVSAVDTSGRYTGLMAAASGVGTAIAVTLLGRIITGYGYASFTWALIIISTTAAALMVFVARKAPARRE